MSADTVAASLEDDNYDEFAFLEETAEEWGLAWKGRPRVERREIEVSPGQTMSALVWGDGDPELVFLHGGGQNAHTWDTVMLALGRPAVAFDFPSHGHSSRRADGDFSPWGNAEALQVAMPALAPNAKGVIGMSLGGATNIHLAAIRPDLVKRAIFVDVTPQVNDPTREWKREDRGTVALIGDGLTYATFEDMAAATIALSPFRSPQSVRRGVRHNAKRLPDGRWGWRYDMRATAGGGTGQGAGGARARDFTQLWDDVSKITIPAMLVVGGASKFVREEDIAEMKRRLPSIRVESVPGAGHAVQSDRPLDLARLIEEFILDNR
jgi:pimeloyl-ACP methyl ester carboxylesterase